MPNFFPTALFIGVSLSQNCSLQSTQEIPPIVYINCCSMKSSMKNLAVLALSAMKLSQEAVVAQAVVPGDYIGGFRLRLYWEEGYNWQESSGEKFWCMECDGSCEDGDKMRK
jgi:hypothetical protein